MFSQEVKRHLRATGRKFIEWGPWHVWGIGESALQTQLSAIEHDLLKKYPEMHVSYQAHAGYVSYGFKAEQSNQSGDVLSQADVYDVLTEINRIEAIFGQRLLYRGTQTLVERLHDCLTAAAVRISLAESCTGGRISAELTKAPGISSIFSGGVVTYSNESKNVLLGVSTETLRARGAVSDVVAAEMAMGARRTFDSSLALSVTGIAGPGGETAEKPVGTVCFAIAMHMDLWRRLQDSVFLEMMSLQGWALHESSSQSSDVILCAEKRFGKHLSRDLVQKRACVFALCTLVAVAESLGGVKS